MRENEKGHGKIRVLHLLSNLEVGGAEVLLLHCIQALGMRDYEHFVYYFLNDGPIRKKLEALGIPVYRGKRRASIKRPIKFGISLIFFLKDLLAFIRSRQIQIIHAHLGQANQVAVVASKLSGVPAFATVHSPKAFVDPRSRWDPRVQFVKVVDAIIYLLADRVLVVSDEIKEVVRRLFHLDRSRVLVLKNGIVLDDNPLKPINLGKEVHLTSNRLKLIAVGRLVPLKAFDVLVSAVSELVNQGLDNLLVLIVGEGVERLRLEKLIQDLRIGSYVKLMGLRHDVMELMKACDLFALPSRYEGLSIAMIEAMACGLPIISSDVRGLKDYIKHEQNGLIFPVDDHKALAKSILRIANNKNLRERLSCGAREAFEKEYDMRKNIRSIDMLFKKYAGIR
jgi:glycosyltransferase involved in cell wall biosynthesis